MPGTGKLILNLLIAVWVVVSIGTCEPIHIDELYSNTSQTVITLPYDPVTMHYPISPEVAKANAVQWCGEAINLTLDHVIQVVEAPAEDGYVFRSSDGQQDFEVSPYTGEVTAWAKPSEGQWSGPASDFPPSLPTEIISPIATDFVRSHYASFDSMGMQSWRGYPCLFYQVFPNGVWVMPNYAEVGINPITRNPYRYRGCHYGSLNISTEPTLSETEVEGLAASFLMADPDIDSTQLISESVLHVGLDKLAAPRLLWAVGVRGLKSGTDFSADYQIELDAHTGEILQVNCVMGHIKPCPGYPKKVKPVMQLARNTNGRFRPGRIVLSGKTVPMGQILLTDGCRFWVRARGLESLLFRARVTWHNSRLIVAKGDSRYVISLNSSEWVADGVKYSMPYPALLHSGTMYLPAEVFSAISGHEMKVVHGPSLALEMDRYPKHVSTK